MSHQGRQEQDQGRDQLSGRQQAPTALASTRPSSHKRRHSDSQLSSDRASDPCGDGSSASVYTASGGVLGPASLVAAERPPQALGAPPRCVRTAAHPQLPGHPGAAPQLPVGKRIRLGGAPLLQRQQRQVTAAVAGEAPPPPPPAAAAAHTDGHQELPSASETEDEAAADTEDGEQATSAPALMPAAARPLAGVQQLRPAAALPQRLLRLRQAMAVLPREVAHPPPVPPQLCTLPLAAPPQLCAAPLGRAPPAPQLRWTRLAVQPPPLPGYQQRLCLASMLAHAVMAMAEPAAGQGPEP
jgi:hypothetical protein